MRLVSNFLPSSSLTSWLVSIVLAFVFVARLPAQEAEGKDPPEGEGNTADADKVLDLTDLGIEELMNVEVSLVSRSKGQSLFTSPAAIHVITEEDIRRTGHQQLPEVLRLVPGMHVARIDANKWALAARGFNNRFNRYQLVQMDGRTLYTPSFAGVFWINQDTVLEDLKQVEVIRGPGATLWGANAVNGIINFESKNAKDTQGLLVSGLAGSEERAGGTLRYGGKIGDDLHWRVYGKHVEHDHFEDKFTSYTDDWSRTQGGFRFDWDGKGADKVTWQGDIYQTKAGSSIAVPDFGAGGSVDETDDDKYHGYNFLTRWSHKLSESNETELQVYYDHTTSSFPHRGFDLSFEVDTFDLDFQHAIALGERNNFVWGLNYRVVDIDYENGGSVSINPTGRTYQTISGFVQDTLSIIKDKLDLTLGTKLEYNPFTDFEYQPSARLVFKPQDKHVLWWAVSRALRVPTTVDDNLRLFTPVAPGLTAVLSGNRDLDAEEVIAFEMGYRAKPVEWFSFDLTAFHNRYDNYEATPFISQLPPVQVFKNVDKGKSYGVEASANWAIGKKLRMSATYSWLDVQIEGISDGVEHSSPANMFHVRSYYDITEFFELNAALYYYDTVPTPGIKAFWRADLGITWRPPVKNLEISVWGTNLFDESHKEYGPDGAFSRGSGEVERGVFGKVTWKF